MAARGPFRHLSERKQALILESDLHRLVLRLEVENFQSAARQIDRTVTAARRVGPLLLSAVSLLGGVVGGRRRENKEAGRKAGWLKTLLRVLPGLLALRGERPEPD
jgi:hypothetical protein